MRPITKTIRRVTVEEYGYGQNARKLVAAFELGDLVTIREHRRRAKFSARIYDIYCWILRCQADKIRMGKLRERKAAAAARLAARR
ncbi:MAG: hypothetical protein ACREFE_08145 [Limisphaerales bacterium]